MNTLPNPTESQSQSVLHWIPWIWSRVLFPGQRESAQRIHWPYFAIVLLLPTLTLYPCMSFYLFEPDEGRYAEIPREMFERGEWVVPLLQSEPYLDKPPLVYWLIMGSYAIFGAHDWSARLVPALAVHGCVLLIYFFGRRRVGERSAFWGALILYLAPGFLGMARLLILDGVLAFLVTLAMLSAYEAVASGKLSRKWWCLAAFVCGLGILTKGPIILVLVCIPLWLHGKLTKDCAVPGWRALAGFLLIALVTALPWYIAICLRLPEFAGYFFWEHNVMRFLDPFDHIRPIWFYLPIIAIGFLPTALLIIPFLRFLSNGSPNTGQQRPPEMGYYLLSGLWCVFFFSLSGSKLPTYILPAFPPLALAVGIFVARTGWHRSRWTYAAATSAFAFVVVGNFFLVPWYAESRSPMNRPQQVRELCADRDVPVLCYPRPIDSVAFYLKRDDLRNYRSKYTHKLLEELQKQPRTVVLFSHRHSCELLKNALPENLHMTYTGPLGLCSMAVVERKE